MVDLRGKPPYLPDGYTYTEVLKEAIGKCLRYNNFDPETHVDPELLNQPGMQRRHVLSSNINQSTSGTMTQKSVGTTIFSTSQSMVSPSGITVHTMSPGVNQTIPTLSTIQSPITIPQMTRFVPIAPAPSGVPLVTQLAASNNISSQQITSSPIQIQIQPSLGQPQRITLNTEPIIAHTVGKDGKQMVVGRREQIMLLQPSTLSTPGGLATIPITSRLDDIAANIQEDDQAGGRQLLLGDNTNSELQDADEDEDEDAENLPPRLPLPIGRLNCSTTRTVLAKLIRFHCGNQLPNYGNPASMPCWWPNHLIDWTQI